MSIDADADFSLLLFFVVVVPLPSCCHSASFERCRTWLAIVAGSYPCPSPPLHRAIILFRLTKERVEKRKWKRKQQRRLCLSGTNYSTSRHTGPLVLLFLVRSVINSTGGCLFVVIASVFLFMISNCITLPLSLPSASPSAYYLSSHYITGDFLVFFSFTHR